MALSSSGVVEGKCRMNKTRRQVCGTVCVPWKAGMPLKRTKCNSPAIVETGRDFSLRFRLPATPAKCSRKPPTCTVDVGSITAKVKQELAAKEKARSDEEGR